MLAGAFRCQVALIGGPRPVVALASGQKKAAKSDLLLSEFPRETLRKIDHIVVANEVEDRFPKLHDLMKCHNVGAIVPFNSHSSTAAHWMLLGEHFSDQVHTPLDFKVVETLFDRIGERFLDNLLLLRSQLAEANDDLRDYQRRLGSAWSELESLRKNLTATEQDNRALREEKANLKRQSFRLVPGGLPNAIESGKQTLEQYLAESEREIVRAALRDCGGNKVQAARLLGVQPRTLHYLIQRHDLDRDEVT
jgi:DNA-binding protein Fis